MKREITIEKIESLMKDKKYIKLVDDIISSLKNDKIVPFVPGKSQKWEYGEQTENYRKELCNMIYPFLEEDIYGSPIKTIDVKFLRHLKTDQILDEGAFLWHSDNHPPEIINIIVYLTDVGERDGGMQYVKANEEIVKRTYTNPPGNHVLEDIMQGVENESSIEFVKMVGEKGTVFVFDNCIFHRATVPLDKDRDALLLQVEPSTERQI